MPEVNWSESFPLFSTKHHLTASGRPGVYRIRFFKPEGAPFSISRLAGVDRDGVLHIGKSNNLGRRIRQFRQAAEGLKASQHAGKEFVKWKFDHMIAREMLRFDYFETRDEQDALKLEKALHDEYRLKFLDRPPLDSTSGQSIDTREPEP
jgi:excinuclease UvrABC nuclease subunit